MFTAVNAYVAPSLQPMHEITPNLAIPLISPWIFQRCLVAPDHAKLSLVCSSIAHRMNQNKDVCEPLRQKFFHCRGLMIRSLRDDLTGDFMRNRKMVIQGIFNLLLVDVSQGRWKNHHWSDDANLVPDRKAPTGILPSIMAASSQRNSANHKLQWRNTSIK